MKHLLIFVFVLVGIAYSHSAIAQTNKPDNKKEAKKVDSTASQQSKGAATGTGSGNSGGGITIDESGVPKTKNKPSNAAPGSGSPTPNSSKPKEEKESGKTSEKSADLDDISPIAIDESGTPKVKKGKASVANTPEGNQPVADSMVAVPASTAPKVQ